jgi:hypothetical protein
MSLEDIGVFSPAKLRSGRVFFIDRDIEGVSDEE